MGEKLGSIMRSKNSLKIIQDESGRANISGVPIQVSEGDRIKINDNFYELTPGKYEALSDTRNIGKNMKNENDILMMMNIVNDLGYTGRKDRDSKGKRFFTITLPKLVDEIQNKTSNEITDDSDVLQGEGVKINIRSSIIDIYVAELNSYSD